MSLFWCGPLSPGQFLPTRLFATCPKPSKNQSNAISASLHLKPAQARSLTSIIKPFTMKTFVPTINCQQIAVGSCFKCLFLTISCICCSISVTTHDTRRSHLLVYLVSWRVAPVHSPLIFGLRPELDYMCRCSIVFIKGLFPLLYKERCWLTERVSYDDTWFLRPKRGRVSL